VEVKGFEFLIRSMARVYEKYPQTRLTIIGEGPLRAELEALTRNLAVDEAVEFVGAASRQVVRDHFSRAHLFAMSCIRANDGSEEGQGLVFIEAQACGLPVLATRSGGIPEVIRDGESGFLVPERDVDMMSERLGWLVSHPDAWPGIGRAGRRFVETAFDLSRLNAELAAVYEDVVADRNMSGAFRTAAKG